MVLVKNKNMHIEHRNLPVSLIFEGASSVEMVKVSNDIIHIIKHTANILCIFDISLPYLRISHVF